jgi:hypothetical protein
MTATMPDMLKPEEREAIRVFLSERQSGGHSGGEVIDRDWLLQPENTQPFMLHYFPRSFWEWEPINDIFYDFIENNTKGVVWCPAGHGKTTMIGRLFIRVWCIDPQVSIGYTEKNEPLANLRGLAILQELSGNARLIHDFGRFKPTDSLLPWAMGKFTIRQRKETCDSPSFSAFGAGGGSILGVRFNILVNDDPVTAENSESEQERKGLLRWFNAAAKTCPIPLPISTPRYLVKHFLIGTPFRMDDLYHSVQDSKEFELQKEFPLLHLKAVIDEAEGLTLSRRYAYEEPNALALKAETSAFYAELQDALQANLKTNLYTFRYGTDGGTLAYFQRYQCQPIDPDAQEWKEVYFRGDDGEYPGCFDEERSYGEFEKSWTIVTALDPQSGHKTKSSARVGLVTLAADLKKPKIWYVIGLDYGKWKQQSADPNMPTQMKALVEALEHFDSQGIIENNAAQAGLVDAARIEAKRQGKVIRVKEHHTGANKNAPDVGLASLLPMFERGAVRLPYKTDSDKKKSNELMNEFTMKGVYPYTDLMMAFWMAAYHLRKRLESLKRPDNDEPIPEYVNRLDDIDWPVGWTMAQRRAYLGLDEDLEEAV